MVEVRRRRARQMVDRMVEWVVSVGSRAFARERERARTSGNSHAPFFRGRPVQQFVSGSSCAPAPARALHA